MKEKENNMSKEDKDKMEFILKQKQDNQLITNTMAMKLIDLISEHSLGDIDVITTTADLAAFCLHVSQTKHKDPEIKDALEDLFNRSFETYLAQYEIGELDKEMEIIKREKMN